jgi:hypothetical protein
MLAITNEALNTIVGRPRTKGNLLNACAEFVRDRHAAVWPEFEKTWREITGGLPGGKPMASSWYDLALFTKLVDTFSRLIGGDDRQVALAWGSYVLERDMRGGIYRTFLRMVAPTFVFRMYGRIWSLYQDSGAISVTTEDKQSATFVCYGLATPSHLVWWGTVGACVKILELCGTKDVKYEVLRGGGKGDKFVEFRLRWAAS